MPTTQGDLGSKELAASFQASDLPARDSPAAYERFFGGPNRRVRRKVQERDRIDLPHGLLAFLSPVTRGLQNLHDQARLLQDLHRLPCKNCYSS
jgi:hypothetical protein